MNFYGTAACCHLINHYESGSNSGKHFNARIRNRLCSLSQLLADSVTPEEFLEHMVAFYKDYGVGKLGLHKAFRLEHKTTEDKVEIVPITKIAHVHLDDLVGYEIPKKKLIENTEAFLQENQPTTASSSEMREPENPPASRPFSINIMTGDCGLSKFISISSRI